MLDMGFAQDVENISAGETRWRKQTMLFSATLEGDALRFLPSVCWKTRLVSANPSTRERPEIHQWCTTVPAISNIKICAVEAPAKTDDTASVHRVCVRKRERVHELAETLRLAGISNCYLEGEMAQIRSVTKVMASHRRSR